MGWTAVPPQAVCMPGVRAQAAQLPGIPPAVWTPGSTTPGPFFPSLLSHTPNFPNLLPAWQCSQELTVPRGCRCLCTFLVSGAALGEAQAPYRCLSLPGPSPVLASSIGHSRASRLPALPPDWVGAAPGSWPFSHLLNDLSTWQLPSYPCRRPPHRGRTGAP